jgi:dGTPase
VDTQFPGASPRVRFWEIQRQIMSVLIGGLIHGTVAAAQRAQVQSLEDVRALPYRIGVMTAESAEVNQQLKGLLVRYVFEHSSLKTERAAAVRKVGELFDHLLIHPEDVSAGYRESLAHTPLHRVVCDYIAGMTDTYLLRTHRALLG